MCILEAGFVFASVQELKALTKLVSKVTRASIGKKLHGSKKQHGALFSRKRSAISCLVKRGSSLDSPITTVRSDSDVPTVGYLSGHRYGAD